MKIKDFFFQIPFSAEAIWKYLNTILNISSEERFYKKKNL